MFVKGAKFPKWGPNSLGNMAPGGPNFLGNLARGGQIFGGGKFPVTPDLQRSNLIYEFTCPGCNESYIGKTERNLNTRLKEHLDPAKSAISKHLTDCDNANYLININNLYDSVFDSDSQTGDSPHYSFTNIIQNNTRILHSLKFSNSNLLLFLEAFIANLKNQNLTVA